VLTVQFEKVWDENAGRYLGHFYGEGESVDDAWESLCENLRERGDGPAFSYDDWHAA
jgi:hypothetical protein